MTAPLTLQLDAAILARWPDLVVAGLLVDGLSAAAPRLDAELPRLWREASQALTARGLTVETLPGDPLIAPWRAAAAASGLKPSDYRSSVEALARRVLADSPVQTPLPAVNAYCAVSVRHLIPLGAWDCDRLPARAVSLRHARPATDRFTPLGGGSMPLTERVAVYAAGDRICCWSFNHRDAADTALLAGTDRAVFLGETLVPDGVAPLRAALADLAALLQTAGARTGPIAIANVVNPFASFALP